MKGLRLLRFTVFIFLCVRFVGFFSFYMEPESAVESFCSGAEASCKTVNMYSPTIKKCGICI